MPKVVAQLHDCVIVINREFCSLSLQNYNHFPGFDVASDLLVDLTSRDP